MFDAPPNLGHELRFINFRPLVDLDVPTVGFLVYKIVEWPRVYEPHD